MNFFTLLLNFCRHYQLFYAFVRYRVLYYPLFAFLLLFRSRNFVNLRTCTNFVNLMLPDLYI